MLTQHQIKRLRSFSNAVDDSNAGMLIQDTTDILNNMFRFVKYEKPEVYLESISKLVISILLDSRIQITIFALTTVRKTFIFLFKFLA